MWHSLGPGLPELGRRLGQLARFCLKRLQPIPLNEKKEPRTQRRNNYLRILHRVQ